jgi:glycosyltransferase involved in cell wall biosynthesis
MLNGPSPRVAIFTAYFTPAEKAGGPVRSIDNLVKAIAPNTNLFVITSDRDHGAAERMPEVTSDTWQKYFGATVIYLSRKSETLGALRTVIRQLRPDTIYLNSLFEFRYSILVLILAYLHIIPFGTILLAPRGELQEGNFAIKRTRKRLFLAIGKSFGLFRGIQWHATSQDEAEDIVRMMNVSADNILVIRNLRTESAHSDRTNAEDAEDSKLRVLFLGRVSKEKNLAYALRVLLKVCRRVQFDVFGNYEDAEYLDDCRRLAAAQSANVQVTFHGHLPHSLVTSTILKYDIMFLPTVGENYGHSIVESLLAGTPVLISDQTPWRNLERQQIGWDLPLRDPAAFTRVLESYGNEELPRFPRVKVQDYARELFDDRKTLAQYVARFSLKNHGYSRHGLD